MFTDEELIDAIRSHPTIGRNTSSVIDACFSDEDIVRDFSNLNKLEVLFENATPHRCHSLESAVKLAVSLHNTYHSMRGDL